MADSQQGAVDTDSDDDPICREDAPWSIRSEEPGKTSIKPEELPESTYSLFDPDCDQSRPVTLHDKTPSQRDVYLPAWRDEEWNGQNNDHEGLSMSYSPLRMAAESTKPHYSGTGVMTDSSTIFGRAGDDALPEALRLSGLDETFASDDPDFYTYEDRIDPDTL